MRHASKKAAINEYVFFSFTDNAANIMTTPNNADAINGFIFMLAINMLLLRSFIDENYFCLVYT